MALISRNLLRPRPQELGKIKIGGKGDLIRSRQGNDFRPPEKYDHFVVTTRVRDDETENFIRDDRIHREIGDKPLELHGVLMYPKPEENFHSEMCIYKGRTKKVRTCDGEHFTNLDTGEVRWCERESPKSCECKPYARLHLQLAASDMLGYHVFRTGSWESTNNIQTALEEIYRTFGTCYHAPVKLVLYPSEDTHDGKVTTSHKVGLVLTMSLQEVAAHIAEARQFVQLAAGEMKQLAAGVQEDLERSDQEEERHIAEEFYSDVTDEQVHALKVENAIHAPDPDDNREEPEKAGDSLPQTATASQNTPATPPQRDRRTQDLAKRYEAALSERDVRPNGDRAALETRLYRQGLVTKPTSAEWSAQDFRSAIAEVEKIPPARVQVPDDDPLFGG